MMIPSRGIGVPHAPLTDTVGPTRARARGGGGGEPGADRVTVSEVSKRPWRWSVDDGWS
jgi:hypothetical protein